MNSAARRCERQRGGAFWTGGGPCGREAGMPDRSRPPKPPRAPKSAKAERLAEALRTNLARRKAQKRARDGAGGKQG